MKLFRKRKPENGEEEDELVFDADAAEEDSGQEIAAAAPEAAASPAAQVGPTPAADDPLAQMRADAAGETPAEGAAPSPQPDDPLDAGLMDLFREAKNEVQESTLASELPDIPIQDLLSDLVNVSECLGITPRVRAQPRRDSALDSDGELRAGGK